MVNIDSGHQRKNRAQKRAELREHLYNTAIRYFRVRGYDATTVNDITAAADVAKGTFFNYFPSKEHVLAEYQRRMGVEILNELRGRPYRSAEGAVLAAVRLCAAWAQNDPTMGRLILRVFFTSEVLVAADESNEEELGAFLHERITLGIASGELRKDLKAELLVSSAIGLLSSSILEWAAAGCTTNVEREVGERVRLLFRGARGQK